MLPPVRAALTSNADYQAPAPTVPRARIDVAQAPAQSEPEDNSLLSGGRLDIASLSAQLKLAQGSSIFAETIGKLLKIPRLENEPLADYAARLTEAVQALKPAERVALERALNQLVKGISLRLLTEILKNPVGPEAARLSVYLEMAGIAERDLAAKAVISSYRQNGQSETPVNAGTPRAPSGGATGQPAPPANGTPSLPPAIAAASAASPAPPAAMPPASPTADPQASEEAPAAKPQRIDDQRAPKPADLQTSSPGRQGNASAGQAAATASASSPVPAANKSDLVPSQQAPPRAPSISGEPPASPRVPSRGENIAEPSLRPEQRGTFTGTTKNDDAPQAVAKRAYETLKREMLQVARSGATGSDRTVSELARWLAAVFNEGDVPEISRTAARPANPSVTPAATESATTNPAESARIKDGVSQGPAPASGADEAEQPAGAERVNHASRAANGASQGAEKFEQQIGNIMPAPWQAQTRDGVPWPYVNYPPAEEEPPREERRTREISAIGDEEEEAPSQGHGFQDDHRQEEAEDQESGDGDAETQRDDEEGRPNDLYWRMAGWA